MSALIPFEQAKLPANLSQIFAATNDDDLSAGVGRGFPVLSIKGKVFHLTRGDEKTLITKPGAEDEPAAAIEVVILKSNPALSKTYYAEGYVEGSVEKPTCYSNDGLAPAADAQEPQAKKCATCAHNQWGSKITDAGKKVKACADVRRLAVAPLGQLNDPMLLRVPAASLPALAELGQFCKKRGQKYNTVGTKIGFDYSVAHPALTFKALGALPPDMLTQVAETLQSDVVDQIVGLTASPHAEVEAMPPLAAPEAPPTPKKAAAVAAAPAPAPVVKVAVEDEEDTPPPPKPAAKAKAAPKAKEINVAELDAELDTLLASAGLDDADDEE